MTKPRLCGLVLMLFVGLMLFADAKSVNAQPCPNCTYSVGSAPTMTNWPTSTSIPENATTTFSAFAQDTDTITYNCYENTSVSSASDCTTCIWAASDGTALSSTRGTSFTWRSPKLNANECSRVITITITADDLPCSCSPCGGARDDAPNDTKTLTVTVYRPLECDNDGNGTLEDCKHCDNDKNQTYEACYACKNVPTDTSKTRCFECDQNNDGINDGCSVRLTTLAQVQACANPVRVAVLPPNGCGPDGASGGAEPADIDGVINNPCRIMPPTSTSFQACCLTHDDDYGKCNKPKQQSDTAFRACMNAACNAAGNPDCAGVGSLPLVADGNGGFRFRRCTDWVTTYYNAVVDHGDGAYETSQTGSCRCCTAQ